MNAARFFSNSVAFAFILLFAVMTILLSFSSWRVEGFTFQQKQPVGQQQRRRSFLEKIGAVPAVMIAATIAVPPSSPVEAAVATDAGEAIRRGAANLPGYGPSDVFYPRPFQGLWKMQRQVSINDETKISLNYDVRFIASIQDESVVADRGFNQANLETAIRRQQTRTDSAKNTDVYVQSYQWLPSNPNDLRMIFADGSRKDIKVTKRASDITDETVFSSEFQRVSQENGGGIPVITARRVLTKWKILNESVVEGLELVYDMGVGGDPLSMQTLPSQGGAEPKLLSKSRLRMVR